MGSWDISPFGNDEARDWLEQLISGNSTEAIFRALVSAAKSKPSDFLQAPECERAVAAAEIVASVRGKPGFELPERFSKWLSGQNFVAGDQIAQMAVRVLDRIASDSELKQVWDDTDSSQEWYASLRNIQERLKEMQQPVMQDDFTAPPTVEDICERAAVLVAEQQHEKALELYDQAVGIDPSAQMIYMGRAICHLWMGNFENVVDDVNKALSIGKGIPDAYQLRSQAFFHLKKYRNVVADLTNYLSVRPQNYESYLIRGLAYLNLKQYQNAINDFTVIIDKNQADHLRDAHTHRAESYDLIGRKDLAAWDRQRAAQLDAAALYRPR